MVIKYYFSKILKKLRGSSVKNSIVHKSSKIESGSSVIGSSIDRHSFCGYDCSILNCDIGAFCSIASRVTIGGVAHPLEFVSTSPVFLSHKDSVKTKFAKFEFLPDLRTHIGNDVWIGDGVYIKAGVRIGHGAVIGMGSIVTKNVEPYSIVAGNPARLIRYRFDNKLIESMLQLGWWDWPDERIQKFGYLFNSPEKLVFAILEDNQ